MESVRDEDASPPLKPFAVIDGPQQRRHIVLADRSAQQSGVRSGQPLAAARALCPRLETVPRDRDAEKQALESIATLAYRFSGEVSIAEPDAVFLEIGASLALFGGIAALERRLRHELTAFGFDSTSAIAPTATGAAVLAAHADGIAIPSRPAFDAALGLVPIALAGFDEKTAAALHGMGFRRLRDVFRLPRAELARRIGQAELDRLDRMRGLAAESLPRYRPPDVFLRRIELPFGIESHGALAFPLARLIRELATFLVARDGGVERFSLVLGHERGATTRVDVGLLSPRRDAETLLQLARARLERLALPAPVHVLALRADDLPPLCPLHQDLFDRRRGEMLDWPALIERLRARLGDTALHGLRCVADHRPARAWQFTTVDASERPRDLQPSVISGDFRKRPLWLLPKPMLLRGEPAGILAGPERIESGWWDEHDKRRDYYIVETSLGQRAWAFVPAESDTGWTLHGWFA
ncbi:MAG TPA: DNA polymerase Y family protein [Rhodanobacteraceae bacterium]